jgi:hypothetical protein
VVEVAVGEGTGSDSAFLGELLQGEAQLSPSRVVECEVKVAMELILTLVDKIVQEDVEPLSPGEVGIEDRLFSYSRRLAGQGKTEEDT